jgi:hypothetical protein
MLGDMPLIFGIMPNHQVDALLPRIRQAVLARLLIDPSRSWYLSELAESYQSMVTKVWYNPTFLLSTL